jgi:hypothetical protein
LVCSRSPAEIVGFESRLRYGCLSLVTGVLIVLSPTRKQANISVGTTRISFDALPCRKEQLDDGSRLDVVEMARVPDMLLSLFPSWSGLRTYRHPGSVVK